MKKVIIVGGGIAGLTAGIYAQKAGLQSVIHEKHTISGGECTGWDRKGFHIDGCIHWLTGTKAGTDMNHIWKEIGGLTDVEVYQPDTFATVEFGGTTVTIDRDIDKLKAHLTTVSPEDKEEIQKLCDFIKPFYAFEPPCQKPLDLMTFFEKMKFYSSMQKVGGVIAKLGKQTVGEYVQRFKSQAIQEIFLSILPGHYSAYILPSSLGTFISGNGGRPRGGSRAFAKRIEDTYKNLGGELVLRSEVEGVIIENGTAKGVLLANGSKELSDYVVAACDTHIVFKKLLADKFSDSKFEERYRDEQAYPLQTCVYAAFGVDADLSDYPENHVIQVKPFNFEDEELSMLSLKHYCYEPSFAPPGKSVVIVYFHAKYDWWKSKHLNKDEYEAQKKMLAQDVTARIESHFPELEGKITTLDVATPLTYERYCGAYKGSWMAFGATPKGKQLMHDGRIKGLKNLYMAGQWLMPPGGLPIAAVTGKWAIQRIVKDAKL